MPRNIRVSIEFIPCFKRLVASLPEEEVAERSFSRLIALMLNQQWEGEERIIRSVIAKATRDCYSYLPYVINRTSPTAISYHKVRHEEPVKPYIENPDSETPELSITVQPFLNYNPQSKTNIGV